MAIKVFSSETKPFEIQWKTLQKTIKVSRKLLSTIYHGELGKCFLFFSIQEKVSTIGIKNLCFLKKPVKSQLFIPPSQLLFCLVYEKVKCDFVWSFKRSTADEKSLTLKQFSFPVMQFHLVS